MCNRARFAGEPETLLERFGANWLTEYPRDNRFRPQEFYPKNRLFELLPVRWTRG